MTDTLICPNAETCTFYKVYVQHPDLHADVPRDIINEINVRGVIYYQDNDVYRCRVLGRKSFSANGNLDCLNIRMLNGK